MAQKFIGEALAAWAKRHGIELRFIQPGKPMQISYRKRFNHSYRTEELKCYVLETLGGVHQMTVEWITRYNELRTHESLGKLSPRDYLMTNSTILSTSK